MSLLSRTNLVEKLLRSKKFRDAYVYEHVRNGIPFQIRALRDERNWSQADLGNAAKKPRNVITRVENPNYGKLTLKTLFEIASAFEVALLVKFVPFSRLVKEYEDVSALGLRAARVSDSDEIARLEAWTAETTRTIFMTAGSGKTAGFVHSLVEQATSPMTMIRRKPNVPARSLEQKGTQETLVTLKIA